MEAKIPWDFPSSPVVKTQLPTQEVQVLSLVGELRSHMQQVNEAHAPQLEKPVCHHEEPVCCNKEPAQQKGKKKRLKKISAALKKFKGVTDRSCSSYSVKW